MHKPVQSSHIKSIGYNPETKDLEVMFHGGKIFTYRNVPTDIHEKFMSAPSKGKFLHQHLRGKYV